MLSGGLATLQLINFTITILQSLVKHFELFLESNGYVLLNLLLNRISLIFLPLLVLKYL